ncbi:DNA-binding protein [Paenibacillus brasilensis]|uniref:PTS system, beta-glucoside-specific IIBCA subunits n=1 Tax=Paenibacillus brasilensis TaxID=128574 RepID=A0A3Q8H8P4_9BACL|nr:DNA-binding protein [Paenibacillus brasilensis]AXJ99447.1 PTS system, beta-glucoside-specific IIBCA subunits [Paenibacillus brasilensis]MDQ0495115.1 tetratricopeptide (TPR) repeat protein [Paenibacillus brasilensis]
MDDLVHSHITDLDTLVNMIKLSFSFADGADMIALCDHLYNQASQKYQELQLYKARKKPVQLIHNKRPLVYYYGYSHLMKGMAFQKQGNYEAARDCIEKYAELGWFNGLDPYGEAEVEYYRHAARANLYALDILSGHSEALEDYVQFLRDNPEELLPGLLSIVEGAYRYDYPLEDILQSFAEQIDDFKYFEEPVNVSYYFRFCYQLALYYIKQQQVTAALDYILQSLMLSDTLGMEHEHEFRKCTAIFEVFRTQATATQQDQYITILKGVLKDEKIDFTAVVAQSV